MVVNKDNTGKTKTIYECDRCHKKIDTAKFSSFKLSVRKTSDHNTFIESWDLCYRCLNVIRTTMKFRNQKYLKKYYKKNRKRLLEEKRNKYYINKNN